VRVLEQDRAQDIVAQRRLRLATLGRVKPSPLLILEARHLFLGEGGPQALLHVVLDAHGAVFLDPGHDLGEHGQAFVVAGQAGGAELPGGGAGGVGTELVAFEKGDLMTILTQALGDGAADDPAPNHDYPRHMRNMFPRTEGMPLPTSWGGCGWA